MSNALSYDISSSLNVDDLRKSTFNVNSTAYSMLSLASKDLWTNDIELGKYRSVVYDPVTNNLLSVAPSKAVTNDYFIEKNPNVNSPNIFANEAVEGTMINMFYDGRSNEWQIATRNKVGANYWFFRTQYTETDAVKKQKTFLEMFIEAMGYYYKTQLNDITILKDLPKNYTYSFVLQHPDNHIVEKVSVPKVYLVGVMKINDNSASYVPQTEYMNWPVFFMPHNPILFPKIVKNDNNSYENIKNICKTYDHQSIGVMLTNLETGERTHFENEEYKMWKQIRGNNPNLQYHYLVLYRIGKVTEFLSFFPMYKKIFYRFYTAYHNFITEVHEGYLSYYIKKESKPIDKRYFIHVSKIHHEIYLPSLATNEKKKITHRVVREYFDKFEPGEVLYYLNN